VETQLDSDKQLVR